MSENRPKGRSRVLPGLALALGLILLATAGFAAWRSRPAADFGNAAVPAVAAPAASSAGPATTSGPAKTSEPAATSGAARKAPADEVAPAKLRIPALQLDATVDAVGVEASTGDFAVPPSVDRVGWYRYGPGFTATTGSIVIAGHVDSADQGKGAFFGLGTLAEGDTVTLTGDGRDRAFTVVARERYRKTKIPLDRYFARDGKPRLTLITCGGPFDTKTRHYRDNVVVTAVPKA
jgi:hypothetical protein